MTTILDMSNVAHKAQEAYKLGQKLQELNHENLLNFVRPFRYEDTHIPSGLMVFDTEAPDHRCSWKTFCKLNFDLEQTLSIFRMLTAGLEHIH
jgi:hypothetical protein